MTADVRTSDMPADPGRRYKRNMRNWLLQPAFQLKYTFMVMAVTIVVASTLGAFAYKYSRGQTELLTIHRMETAIDRGEDVSEQFTIDLQHYAAEADRKVLTAIVVGILALALALGATGIVVTHRLVGPAYRLKNLLGNVRDGHWRVTGRLRKGDELQDIFEAYQEMIESLRQGQAEEIAMLDAALEKAATAGADEEAIASLRKLRDRMQAVLD